MSAAGEDEQAAFLEEAFGYAAEYRFNLRKAIQQEDVEMALRYSLRLANELRTSKLWPQNYFKLYSTVLWELQHLATFLMKLSRRGLKIAEVYQLAQCEGNAVPRMYLLVTVGMVYVQSKQDLAVKFDVLEDLNSMLSAVQHPMRGLFLRYYLLQVMKDRLIVQRGLKGAMLYILNNLKEATSLWTRLRLEAQPPNAPHTDQAQGCQFWGLDPSRKALKFLLSAHMLHLARLAGLTVQLYSEVVLPELLKLITVCEDAPGQAYILQSLVDLFPDDFHLHTLHRVLAAASQVHWAVDLTPLTQLLLKRLSLYQKEQKTRGIETDVDTFELFQSHLAEVRSRERTAATPLTSLLKLQLELLLAGLSLHPGDMERADCVLRGAVELLGQRGPSEELDDGSVGVVIDLMAAPLTQEGLAPLVLAATHHTALLAALKGPEQRQAALAMVSAILAGDVPLKDCATLEKLVALMHRLLRDDLWQESQERGSTYSTSFRYLEHNPEAFATEQETVARLIHQVRHEDPCSAFEMLKLLRQHFSQGGPYRIVYTLPAMVIATLRLAKPLQETRESSTFRKVSLGHAELFAFATEMLEILGARVPEETLRLWLLAAATVSTTKKAAQPPYEPLHEACSSFIGGALNCLQKQVVGEEAKLRGLAHFVGTLTEVTDCVEAKDHIQVAEELMSLCQGIVTKKVQSKAFCLCSSLFWRSGAQEPEMGLLCIRRALECADCALHVNPLDVSLFIDVLDQAAALFNSGSESLSASLVSALVAMCTQHLKYIESRAPEQAMRGLHAALQDLKDQQLAEATRYADVVLPTSWGPAKAEVVA